MAGGIDAVMGTDDPVRTSLRRWRDKGWIDEPTFERLDVDAESHGAHARKAFASRALAASAAVVLVAALITLATIYWGDISKPIRALFLWAATGAVMAWALLRTSDGPLPREVPWLAAVTMPLAMFSTILVDDWLTDTARLAAEGTRHVHPGTLVAVALTFAVIGFVGYRWHTRSVVAPVSALGFLFVMGPYLGGLYNLDSDPIIITLDVLAVAVALTVGAWTARLPDDPSPVAPRTRHWFLLVTVVAGAILVPMTWYETLDQSDQLGHVILWLVVAAGTMAFAIRYDRDLLLVAGTLLLIIDAWFFGLDQGERWGTVLALAFSAVALFWLARRVGRFGRRRDDEGDADDEHNDGPDPQVEGASGDEGSEP